MMLKIKRLLNKVKNKTNLLKKLKEHKNKTKEPESSELLDKINSLKFEYLQGISYGNMYMRMYQAPYNGLTVYMQTNTKRDRYGHPKGKGNTFYFVNGHDKEYANLKDIINLIDRGLAKGLEK